MTPRQRMEEGIRLKPCPFCGGIVDPEGWLRNGRVRGPECNDCGATAVSVSAWQERAQPAPDKDYVLRRKGYFFRPDAQGYTGNLAEAGRWTKDDAVKYLVAEGVTLHSVAEWEQLLADVAEEKYGMRKIDGVEIMKGDRVEFDSVEAMSANPPRVRDLRRTEVINPGDNIHFMTMNGVLLKPGLPGLEVIEEVTEADAGGAVETTVRTYRYFVPISLKELLAGWTHNEPDFMQL